MKFAGFGYLAEKGKRLGKRYSVFLALFIVAQLLCISTSFAATENLTGSWTDNGDGTWSSTTANGVTVTASVTVDSAGSYDGSAWEDVGVGEMTQDDVGTNVFTNPDVYGRVSLQAKYVWDEYVPGGTGDEDMEPGGSDTDKLPGYITFTFSEPVKNPIIYVDRLGETGEFLSNSVQLTLQNESTDPADPYDWTELAGTLPKFDSTSNTLLREFKVNTSGSECSNIPSGGSACGTMQINETLQSFTLRWDGRGVDGSGGDEVEFVLDLPPENVRVPELDVSIVSSADGSLVSPAEKITYTIEVTNTGNGVANNIVLSDVLPLGATYVDGTAGIVTPGPPVTDTYPSPDFIVELGSTFQFGAEDDDATIEYTIPDGVLPVGATLVDYTFSLSGESHDSSYKREVLVRGTSPAGDVFDFNSRGQFIKGKSGTYSETRGPFSASGEATGRYTFVFNDTYDDDGIENSIYSASFTINYQSPGPDVITPLNPPKEIISAADGIDLAPGETITIVLEATVNDPLDALLLQLTNTVSVTSDEITTLATASVTDNLGYDTGDAPASYGTTATDDGPRHFITSGLYLGSATSDVNDPEVHVAQNGDNNDAAEDGVDISSLKIVKEYGVNSYAASLDVTVTNIGREYGDQPGVQPAAQLLCWVDWNGNGVFDAGEVSNPELYSATSCLQSADTDYTSGNVPANCSGTATLLWQGLTTVPATNNAVYSRCRVTSDPDFFNTTTISPTAPAFDGEVEDGRLQVPPTAATIGAVDLEADSVGSFVASLGIDRMNTAGLSALLEAWSPDSLSNLSPTAERDEILTEMIAYLDPDGDGKLAVLTWDTLEEHGTIGFYVLRKQEGSADWQQVNNDMLPGMLDAPMGAEYLLADPAARTGVNYLYKLIEQEAWGTQRQHGPYELSF